MKLTDDRRYNDETPAVPAERGGAASPIYGRHQQHPQNRLPNLARKKLANISLSETCKAIILGSLLGHGTLTLHTDLKRAQFSIRHSLGSRSRLFLPLPFPPERGPMCPSGAQAARINGEALHLRWMPRRGDQDEFFIYKTASLKEITPGYGCESGQAYLSFEADSASCPSKQAFPARGRNGRDERGKPASPLVCNAGGPLFPRRGNKNTCPPKGGKGGQKKSLRPREERGPPGPPLGSIEKVGLRKREETKKTSNMLFQSHSNADLAAIYQICCKPNKTSRSSKTVKIQRRWLNHLTPLALTIWWLDKGSIVNQGQKGVLCTDKFSRKECLILAQYLKVVWHVQVKVRPQKTSPGKKKQNEKLRLWFSTQELTKFLRIILPHIPVAPMIHKVLLLYKKPEVQQRWISEVKEALPQFESDIDLALLTKCSNPL